jgi:tetratricopeptide (TPR) repeat protein
VRAKGRDLRIAVWGWDTLQLEIARYPEAISVFHPDGSPFSTLLLDEQKQVKDLVKRQGEGQTAALLSIGEQLATIMARLPQAAISTADRETIDGSFDKHIHDEIDTYRNLINEGKPRTAIALLRSLRTGLPENASAKLRFRVLANIAVAHHRLGEYDVAAELFLESSALNPDDPNSISNKIAALLIQQRAGEAHALAVEAIERFPDKEVIALQRLQALGPGESVETVWSSLPPSLTAKPQLIGLRIATLRQSRDETSNALLRDALQIFPDNTQLRLMRAEDVLASILERDRSALGAPIANAPARAEVLEAAETFRTAWTKSLGLETPIAGGNAHNGAVAFGILGDLKAAADLLDEAFRAGFDSDGSRRLRVSLFVRMGQIPQASALADRLGDTPPDLIYRADLKSKTDPSAARQILASRERFSDRIDIIASAQIVIDCYLAENNTADAIAEARRLLSVLPDDPESWLALHRALSKSGDPEADKALDEAFRRARDSADFADRFLTADALSSAERHDDVVDLLHGRVSTSRDSAALRLLTSAAANADRRVILGETLSALPPEVLDLPVYRRCRAALALRSGDIPAAEREVRAFLQAQQRNLDMQIQLMQLLARQEKADELRAEAARPAADFDGAPEDFIFLAQFKVEFGDWREAHDLAYRTWLTHQSNTEVNVRYVGVFLGRGELVDLEPSADVVTEGTAVALRDEDGKTEILVIESDPALRPGPRYLAPDHPTAQLLVGKSAGTTVTFSDSSVATIESIKPKQIHALHEIMENFSKLFPECTALQRVPIRSGENEPFRPVFDRVRQRHDAVEALYDQYASGQIPMALVARMLGMEPLEAFYGLIRSGRSFQVCEGTAQERGSAFAAVKANERRGCVVDEITLHLIRILNLEDAVRAMCGPIGIVSGTLLHVQARIHELEERLDETGHALLWRDGQIYRQELSPDEKRATLAALRDDKAWMESNLEILPAQGIRDPSPAVRDLVREMGGTFLNELLAAQQADRLFLCEDRTLRVLAETEFGLRTAWLQPVLMMAVDAKHLSRDVYNDAVVNFIASRFEFISLHPSNLIWTLRNARDVPLPETYVQAIGRLGGPNADLRSHVRVALETIQSIWDNPRVSPTLRLAVVGAALERFLQGRPLDHFAIVFRTFVQFGDQVLRDAEFLDYLQAWLLGHFIALPSDR